MSISVVGQRAGRRSRGLTTAEERERTVRRRVGTVWGLLVLNVMGYSGVLIHIPSFVGKGITQGALPLALIVAMTVNRHIIIRPNLFLTLVTLLPIEATLTALQPQYLGTIYRTFRLIEFVATLWLLTPWWGRRDMFLVRCHLKAIAVILASVLLGLFVAPGHALLYGRLGGALWNVPPTQVAHYAAVALGLVVVLWLCSELPSQVAAPVAIVTVAMLVLTHTRTALVGAVAGIVVAGLSLIVAKARVRRMFALGGAAAAIAVMTASSLVTTWLARGEGTKELTGLTGRTAVWGPLLALHRDRFQELFGFGLNNSSFNGLAIDSNWLSSYQEQGLVGVTICALMLILLFAWAYFSPRGVHRALALFLVTYCLVASFTEDGFTDATPYLLELALAASLLMPSLITRLRQHERPPP